MRTTTFGMLAALLAPSPGAQEATLVLGETVGGVITATTPRVSEGTIPVVELVPTRGVRIALELPSGAEATLHLRSIEVDTYLVVVDSAGEVLAEDDNGGDGLNALIHFQAERDREPAMAYLCALSGGFGAFEVELESGPPANRNSSAKDNYEHALADALARLEYLAEQGRSRSTAAALASSTQGRMLARLERFDEGVAALAGAIALLEELEGAEHALLVEPLNALGVVWLNRGEGARAKPLLERALELGTEFLPERHVLMSSVLSNLAGVLNRGSTSEEGLAMLRRALAVAEEVYGPQSIDTSIMHANLGVVLARRDRFDEAEESYLTALKGLERLGDEHPATLRCLNNLVRLEIRRDHLDEASAWLARVLEALEGSDRMGTLSHARALQRQSQLRYQQGHYHEALETCQEALALRVRIQGPRSNSVLSLQRRYADLLRVCRRNAEAGEVLAELARIVEGSVGTTSSLRSDILLSQARNARSNGDLALSIRLLEDALEDRVRLFGVDSRPCASILVSLGVAHRFLGDLTRAEECAQRAVEIYRAQLGDVHESTIMAEVQLAALERKLNRQAEARARLDGLLARLSLGADHPRRARLVHNTAGVLALNEHRIEDALVHFQRGIELVAHAEDGSQASASLLGNQGTALRLLGRTEEAIAVLRRAKEMAESHARVDLPWIQQILVASLVTAGMDGEAWSESLAMIRNAERTQGAILRELLEHERYHFLRTQRSQLDQHLSLAGDSPERATDALDAVLRWKGCVARSLRQSRTDLFDNLGEDASRALVELRALREQLTDLFWTSEEGDRDRHRARLEELRERVRSYEREILGDSGIDATETAGTAELVGAMSAEEALVVFYTHTAWRGDSITLTAQPARVIAWILRPAGTRRVDLGESKDLHEVVLAYLETMRGMRGVGVGVAGEVRSEDAARQVYEQLWAPLASHLDGVQHLVVSSDGFLNLLPFGTIADGQGRFLLERFSISISDDPLARLVQRSAASSAPSLVAVGGIDYDALSDDPALGESTANDLASNRASDESAHRARLSDIWAPLPHTSDEMRAVLALHRNAFSEDGVRSKLSGQLATEAAVREALSSATVVHIATHGFFDPAPVASAYTDGRIEFFPVAPRLQEDSPGVLAGLVLAGANARESSSRGNGLLTAEELAWLDLRNSDLVVLSACETALGKLWPGKGMASLRSALHSAGVRTVVSSLWAVPDQGTAELMESFYHGMWVEGLPPGESLRRAQLETLARNRFANRGPRPGTWGAFVLSGAH